MLIGEASCVGVLVFMQCSGDDDECAYENVWCANGGHRGVRGGAREGSRHGSCTEGVLVFCILALVTTRLYEYSCSMPSLKSTA